MVNPPKKISMSRAKMTRIIDPAKKSGLCVHTNLVFREPSDPGPGIGPITGNIGGEIGM